MSPYSDVIKNDLAYVLGRAARLTTFEFHPHPAFRVHDDTEQGPHGYLNIFNPAWMFNCMHVSSRREPAPPSPVADAFQTRLRSGMRELDLMSTHRINLIWECSEAIIHIHDVLRSAADTLVILKLGALRIDRFGTLDDLYPAPLVFPALEALYVHHTDAAFDEYVKRAWVLPRLARLTLISSPNTWPEALLATHGRRLRYLHLYPPGPEGPLVFLDSQYAATKLAEQCPELQYLILPVPPVEPLPLQHPSLRDLDVWSDAMTFISDRFRVDGSHEPPPSSVGAALRAAVLDEKRCSLPALRGVRVLIADCPEDGVLPTLPVDSYVDWPIVCSPDALAPDDAHDHMPMRRHVFANTWAMQTDWSVVGLGHPMFEGMSEAFVQPDGGKDEGAGAGADDERRNWERFRVLDGVQPDKKMLRAVLDEQGLEYTDAAADADYICPDDESDSGSDSDSDAGSEGLEDGELEALMRNDMLVDRALQVDRDTVLEGFRRGLLAGVAGANVDV